MELRQVERDQGRRERLGQRTGPMRYMADGRVAAADRNRTHARLRRIGGAPSRSVRHQIAVAVEEELTPAVARTLTQRQQAKAQAQGPEDDSTDPWGEAVIHRTSVPLKRSPPALPDGGRRNARTG